MQLNSYNFILFFLPIVLALYFILNRWSFKAGKHFLIVSSAFFYAVAGLEVSLLLALSITANYICCRKMCCFSDNNKKKKRIFVIAVLLNIICLLYFKYRNFFIESIVLPGGGTFAKIALPLGISFYTFSQLAYLIAVYHDSSQNTSLENYLLYVFFFPKITMGPITEPKDIIYQFDDNPRKKIDLNNIASGIRIFSYGLFKKALLADAFSSVVSWCFENMSILSSLDCLILMLCYTFEIYFDFSGYSDMATGAAQMFNIDLPINFNSPYKAVSIRDFWKRWHISLTSFLTKHVYFPLGGSRKGNARTYINILIVFLVSGIWHGASFTFVLWGLIHGILNATEKLSEKSLEKIPKIIRWCFTFAIINILWLLFASDSISQWIDILKRIMSFKLYVSNDLLLQFVLPESTFIEHVFHISDFAESFKGLWFLVFMIASFAICLIPKNNYETRHKVSYASIIPSVIAFVWGFICLSSESVFIYLGF